MDSRLQNILNRIENVMSGELDEGYKVLPSYDRERYTDLSHEGLEGPFVLQSGKVVYYDPKEGKYYDRDSDFYMSDEEYFAHAHPKSREVNEELLSKFRKK